MGEASDPASDTDDSETAALTDQMQRGALALTEHLVSRVFHEGTVERGEAMGDREIYDFFTTLPQYMENRDHPYCDAVSKTPQAIFIFPQALVRQAADELFGVSDWAFDDSIAYNAAAEQYESGLEFGTGRNSYLCSELQAAYTADMDVIQVAFALEGAASVNGDPGWEDLGRWVIRYQVMGEDEPFLRYESIQKAS